MEVMMDMSHLSDEIKKTAMKKAFFTDAIEEFMTDEAASKLEHGEAHIIIETERMGDGPDIQMMFSCMANLSPGNKLQIAINLIKRLQIDPMNCLILTEAIRDYVMSSLPVKEDNHGQTI